MSDVNNDILPPPRISGAGNYKLNGTEGNRESTPLTEALTSVHNSNHELTSGKISARFDQAWQWLCTIYSGQVSAENGSNEERTELEAIHKEGEILRRQADLLSASETEETRPYGWKGSILLAGVALMGTAGYVGYRSYNARTPSGSQQNTLQPSYTPPDIVKTGGNLGDSFGHHALHHDAPASRTRHRRRHLPIETSSTPLPITIPVDVRIEPVKKCGNDFNR